MAVGLIFAKLLRLRDEDCQMLRQTHANRREGEGYIGKENEKGRAGGKSGVGILVAS